MSPNHFAGKALKFRGSEGFWGPGLSKGLDVAVVILVHRYADYCARPPPKAHKAGASDLAIEVH